MEATHTEEPTSSQRDERRLEVAQSPALDGTRSSPQEYRPGRAKKEGSAGNDSGARCATS